MRNKRDLLLPDKRHLSILIAIIALNGDKMKGLPLRSEKKKKKDKGAFYHHFYSIVLDILAGASKQEKNFNV